MSDRARPAARASEPGDRCPRRWESSRRRAQPCARVRRALSREGAASHRWLAVAEGGADGVDDPVVAGAAAQVAGHELANRVRLEQLGMRADPQRRHDHAGGTGAALRRALREEWTEPLGGNGFDALHPRAAHLVGRDETGIHGQSVQVYRAGAALAFTASFLRAGEPEAVAQRVEQTLRGVEVERDGGTVEGEDDLDSRHQRVKSMSRSGVSGIARGSVPVAAATAFRIAGAGPSMGSSPSPFAPCAPCGYGFSTNATRIGGTSSLVGRSEEHTSELQSLAY